MNRTRLTPATKDLKNATTNNVPHKKHTELTVFTGVMLPPSLHKTLLIDLFLNTTHFLPWERANAMWWRKLKQQQQRPFATPTDVLTCTLNSQLECRNWVWRHSTHHHRKEGTFQQQGRKEGKIWKCSSPRMTRYKKRFVIQWIPTRFYYLNNARNVCSE